MRIRAVIILFILILISSLTGCVSKSELNDISIVTGIALDVGKEENDIKVTFQILDPSVKASEDIHTSVPIIIGVEAATLNDAIQKIQKQLSRKIILSHNHTLIIGESLAYKGIGPYIDYFARYTDSRLQSYIFVSEGNGYEYLIYTPQLENYSGESLEEFENLSQGTNTTMLDLINYLSTPGKDLNLSKISFIVNPAIENTTNTDTSTSNEMISITGVGIFKEEKLVTLLDEEDSNIILLLLNKNTNSKFTISVPTNLEGGNVGFELFHNVLDIETELQSQKIKADIHLHSYAYLYENTSKLDMSNPESIKILKELLETELEAKIYQLLLDSQSKYNSDILGIGREIHKYYPNEWENSYKDNWYSIYETLEITVNVDTKIESVGNINNSLTIKEDEIIKFD